MTDKRTGTETVLRLAVVGAGAVTEKRYLPAGNKAAGLHITHVVDIDEDRARDLATAHSIPGWSSDYRSILDDVDAVVVATPPSTHADIVVGCLEHGVHVLCEKPLAPCLADARRVAAAAERSAALCSIAMVRRVGPAVRILRRLIQAGAVGAIQRIDAEEGGEFSWPLRTGHLFESPGEGGVLRDTGTHLIDLVQWTLGATELGLQSYEDDSWGGAEANAVVHFDAVTPNGSVPSRVEASFTRQLDNTIRVHGESGVIEAPTVLSGTEALLRPLDARESVRLVPDGVVPQSRVDNFATQLEEFATAVRESRTPPVPVAAALPTIGLIDACYAGRARRLRSWEKAPAGARAAEDPEPEPVRT